MGTNAKMINKITSKSFQKISPTEIILESKQVKTTFSFEMEVTEFHVELGETRGFLHYIVDGVRDHRLYLTAGETYKFIINTPGHPFYITSDPFGGSKDPASKDPEVKKVEVGELLYTPKQEDVGKSLYYQCSIHPKMGYKICVSSAK